MTQHTTGPWTAKGPDISAADGTRIATCGITHNYAANARLIAAAPDLLAVAKEILNNQEALPAYLVTMAVHAVGKSTT